MEFKKAWKDIEEQSNLETRQTQPQSQWTPTLVGCRINTDTATNIVKHSIDMGIPARDWRGKTVGIWAAGGTRKGRCKI